jgi:hypothetical protein
MLPDWLCWIWSDGRPPQPVHGVGDGWLGAWSRDCPQFGLPRALA